MNDPENVEFKFSPGTEKTHIVAPKSESVKGQLDLINNQVIYMRGTTDCSESPPATVA